MGSMAPITSGSAAAMLLANAPDEAKLGTQAIFRPLGVLGPGSSGDNIGNAAPSTSPSTALFAQPLF